MTLEEITERATAVLAEEFELDAEAMTRDALLKDTLGLDSLDMVDVVVVVDENFGVKLNKQDFAGVVTYGDFCNLIYNRANG